MFLVVEVDPCIEEIQFAAKLIYNSCTRYLWTVIVHIPEMDVVLNCFARQEWPDFVFNIDLVLEIIFY